MMIDELKTTDNSEFITHNSEFAEGDNAPFVQKGGPLKAVQLFGADLQNILKELSEVLAA